MHKYLILFLFAILLLFSPVSAELVQFWPGPGSISTADVRDISDGTNERVVFATTNGISIYDGEEWETLHALPGDRRGYLEGIPLNDYVLQVEYDYLNNLWIGYTDGIQIYNGYSRPFTIRQADEILFDVSVNRFKRQGRIMWIAAGESGIFYYFNGRMEWVPPGEGSGLTGYHINDIEVDYSDGRLYVASVSEGQFTCEGGTESLKNITFRKISDPLVAKDMTEIVSHPLGGVVFFNGTDVVHYSDSFGGEYVFGIHNLSHDTNQILDLSVTNNGRYVIGTDDGIFCWDKGEICTHLTRFEGLAENYVNRVFVDNSGRWWFTTKETAGYYFEPEFVAVSSIEIGEDSPDSGITLLTM